MRTIPEYELILGIPLLQRALAASVQHGDEVVRILSLPAESRLVIEGKPSVSNEWHEVLRVEVGETSVREVEVRGQYL